MGLGANPNSGAACPGLIEARFTGLFAKSRPRIPGQPAPASLKRVIRGGKHIATIDKNSGAACPGLIEAHN